MHRLAVVLLGAVVAVAGGLVAAPAPFPRPSSQAGPWFDGWDRPVDPVGDCRFERRGDRLTIAVPGQGHEFNVLAGRLNAPRLLRDVKGDFVMLVRISGDFRELDDGRYRGAGILLTDGKEFVPLGRDSRLPMDPPLKPVYFRLRLQGNKLRVAVSEDGKRWERGAFPLTLVGWRSVKVGVYAEATAEGTFKAVFDQFKLTPLGGRSAARAEDAGR
jgi:hypothetical protein